MIVTKSILKKVYPKRKEWSKKGDFGRVLVIGGSYLYSGSPAFNALAAYRAGADLVTIFGPECAADPVRAFAPDIIFHPYKNNCFSSRNVKEALELAKKNDAVVIGGGLTRSNETKSAVREFIPKIKIPCVIDADAIHAMAGGSVKLNKDCIVTPHAYEFFVLTGKKVGHNLQERSHAVGIAAKKFNCTIMLKGHIDVISCGNKTVINNTGSSYMTKGGFGDTLAGVCAALSCRTDSFTAACAAAYINGSAGAEAAKKYKESTMASDLINEISNMIKS
ncbi:MAG: NAD(P)H-hydrate dehydratase [Candidatus Aenigmarchaeota archaeon]|nr:NAD(P)H-hydrate dehydratase [Candidatus Aenigmarchaeota archaeon]